QRASRYRSTQDDQCACPLLWLVEKHRVTTRKSRLASSNHECDHRQSCRKSSFDTPPELEMHGVIFAGDKKYPSLYDIVLIDIDDLNLKTRHVHTAPDPSFRNIYWNDQVVFRIFYVHKEFFAVLIIPDP